VGQVAYEVFVLLILVLADVGLRSLPSFGAPIVADLKTLILAPLH